MQLLPTPLHVPIGGFVQVPMFWQVGTGPVAGIQPPPTAEQAEAVVQVRLWSLLQNRHRALAEQAINGSVLQVPVHWAFVEQLAPARAPVHPPKQSELVPQGLPGGTWPPEHIPGEPESRPMEPSGFVAPWGPWRCQSSPTWVPGS